MINFMQWEYGKAWHISHWKIFKNGVHGGNPVPTPKLHDVTNERG
jgi:hypothetical protein